MSSTPDFGWSQRERSDMDTSISLAVRRAIISPVPAGQGTTVKVFPPSRAAS